MTMKTARRVLLWVGAGVTVILIVVGVGLVVVRMVSELGDRPPDFESLTMVLRLLVGLGIGAVWMLSPYWLAFRQQREQLPTKAGAAVSLLGVFLMVALGTYAYVSEFVILPLFFGVLPKTGSAFLVLFIPLWQWIIILAATALIWAVNRAAHMLDRRQRP